MTEAARRVQAPRGRVDRFILIHGTWGRRSRWTERRSSIYAGLQREFKVPVERFEWSGHNSHRGRIKAATRLAQRLKDYDRQRVVLVAHSHGGNVAIAAARLVAESAVDVKVITLGTPFLVHGRDIDKLLQVTLTALGALGLLSLLSIFGVTSTTFVLVLWAIVCFHVLAHLYSLTLRGWIRRERLGHVLMAMGSPPPTSAFRRHWPLPEPEPNSTKHEGTKKKEDKKKSSSSRDVHKSDDYQKYSDRIAQSLQEYYQDRGFLARPGRNPNILAPVNLRIVSTPTDEAGIALGAGQFLGYLGNTLLRPISWLFRYTGLGILLTVWVALLGALIVLAAAAVTVPVLAYIATGDVADAWNRVRDMFPGSWTWAENPYFTLWGEAFPGLPAWISDHTIWIHGPAAWVWKVIVIAFWTLMYMLVTGTVLLIALMTLLLLEALTLGVDGASLMWDRSITVAPTPLNVHTTTSILLLHPEGTRVLMSHTAFANHPTTLKTIVALVRFT